MTLQGPGARVRITIEGVVRSAQPGEMTLVDGTHVECNTRAVSLELLEPGYVVGDVVTDGDSHLFRVKPDGEVAHWIRPDGSRLDDDKIDPTALTPLVRVTPEPHTEDSPQEAVQQS